jgi:hypothetical protein
MLAIIVCFMLSATAAVGGTMVYSLRIPDGKPANYKVPLQVEHSGTLRIGAEWSSDRLLALRLEYPGGSLLPYKRSGPSPLTLEVAVEPEQAGEWTLSIHVNPARGEDEGLITAVLPDPPGTASADRAADGPASPPPPEPDPWMVVRHAPKGSSPEMVRLFESIETFRALIDDQGEDTPVDSCRWQEDFMRYLGAVRDEFAETGLTPTGNTGQTLERMADAIRLVEEFRSSADPLLAGPPPEEPQRRRVWAELRKERFQPLERELDEVLQTLQRGHVPILEDEVWPVRLVSCLTACQRHFEERVRLGERQATNLEIAEAQWDRMMAASGALRALADLATQSP